MKIVITGASSGIGAALSRYYAKSGVMLALLARNEGALQQVSEDCKALGAKTYVYKADVAEGEQMRAVGAQLIAEMGLPDLVIANAGIRIEDPKINLNADDATRIMMVNYIGVINTFTPFIDLMKERGAGHLVAVSSIAAMRATQNSGIYSASKAAVNLWTEALRLRLAPFNVRVTTACSGFVRTAMTADLPFCMPGILSAEQAAAIIGRAAAARKSRITFPWQSRMIWGIFSLMPGALYDQVILLAKKLWPNRKK